MTAKSKSLMGVFSSITIAILLVNTFLVVVAAFAAIHHTHFSAGLPSDTPRGTRLALVLVISGIGWFLGRIFVLRLIEAELKVNDAVSNASALTLLTALVAVAFVFLSEIPWTLFAILFLLCAAFCLILLWQLTKYGVGIALLLMTVVGVLTWYFFS